MGNPIDAAVEAERARARRLATLQNMRDEMAEALAYRLGGPEPESDGAFRFVGMRFSALVSHLLSFRGENWGSTQEMLFRGIVAGDVPELLTGAGNRVMRQAYQAYSSGLLPLCERVGTRDFRDVKSIQVAGDVGLKPLTEAGEFVEGSVKSSAETFKIETFGRVLGLSRVMLAEDDLGAFADLAGRLGRMAAEFAASKIAALLEANPTLSDSVAAYHAGHGNLGTAGALSETTVAELVKLMRSQKGLGGESIAVRPAALVVPSALEFAARKIVAAITPGNSAPPFEVVVEPRLASAAAHYLVADPSTVAAIAYTYGPGSEGPTFEVGRRPGVEGLLAKVSMDLGCGFIDHRGAAKNAGG